MKSILIAVLIIFSTQLAFGDINIHHDTSQHTWQDILKNLESHGININDTNAGNPFHVLGLIEDTDVIIKYIDLLIKAGFDINAKDSDGKTALVKVLSQQHPDTLIILEEMIRKGADPTIRSNLGLDLLHQVLLLQLVYTEIAPTENTEETDSFSLWIEDYLDVLRQVNHLYINYYQNHYKQ